MVVFKNNHTFNCNFASISLAYLNKYPNRLSTHITTIDTVDREIVSDKIIIHRIIKFDITLPWFFEKLRKRFLNNDRYSYLQEKVILDRSINTMSVEVNNLFKNHYLNIVEKSEYKCTDKQCMFNQNIIVDTPFVMVENFVYKLLKSKSNTSIEIMEEKITQF